MANETAVRTSKKMTKIGPVTLGDAQDLGDMTIRQPIREDRAVRQT